MCPVPCYGLEIAATPGFRDFLVLRSLLKPLPCLHQLCTLRPVACSNLFVSARCSQSAADSSVAGAAMEGRDAGDDPICGARQQAAPEQPKAEAGSPAQLNFWWAPLGSPALPAAALTRLCTDVAGPPFCC